MRPLVTAINDAGMAGGWILSEAGSRVVIAQCNTAAARTHRIVRDRMRKRGPSDDFSYSVPSLFSGE